MTYTIQYSAKHGGDALLSFGPDATESDIARGRALALALHGRWVRGASAYAMQPSRARKWSLLFDAGFSVVRRGSYTTPSHLAFVRGSGSYALSLAVRIATAEAEAAHEMAEELAP